jgi:coproporphyrinogen III oxidase
MSMPPMAKWEYTYVPKTDSEEEKTLTILRSTIDWV